MVVGMNVDAKPLEWTGGTAEWTKCDCWDEIWSIEEAQEKVEQAYVDDVDVNIVAVVVVVVVEVDVDVSFTFILIVCYCLWLLDWMKMKQVYSHST